MMGQGFGDEIARMMAPVVIVGALLVLIVIICVFWLGRCSAQKNIQIQSPIVVKEKP